MPFTFTPPTRQVPMGTDRLWSRITYDEGITLLKQAGFYRQVSGPSQEDLLGADLYYMGGFEYTVDDIEAAALTAAGYGALLVDLDPDVTPPVDPPPLPTFAEYGAGPYGSGDFGE